MTIHSRTAVKAAFERALALHPCRETAIAATAQAMGLTVEIVEECIHLVQAEEAVLA